LSIGFALETNSLLENAEKKLKNKNFDLIVINSPNPGEGFGYDTNKVAILSKFGKLKNYSIKSKKEVASDIVDEIGKL
jgi:phosphopantothenoylcysteine decarboxylase/phosphopantothenate--cysteine ligase